MLPNVAICGSAGAGKGVLAGLLVDKLGYSRVSLADPVKADIGVMLSGGELGQAAAIAWVNDHKVACRGLLQAYGTAKRELVAADYWINLALNLIAMENDHFRRSCVVDDLRFPNEAEAFAGRGFFLVRIDRPDDHRANTATPVLTPEQRAHPSEAQIDGLPVHCTIRNSGTPELLLARFLLALGVHYCGTDAEGQPLIGRATIAAGVFPCR